MSTFDTAGQDSWEDLERQGYTPCAPAQVTPQHVAETLANIVYETAGKDALQSFRSEIGGFLVIVAVGREVEKLQNRLCDGAQT